MAAFDFVSQCQALDKLTSLTAILDQDSTLIQTASGNKFASDGQDWKWWDPSVRQAVRKLFLEDGYVASHLYHMRRY